MDAVTKTSIADKFLDASYITFGLTAGVCALVIDTVVSLLPEQKKLEKIIPNYEAAESVYFSSALELTAGFIGMIYSQSPEARTTFAAMMVDGFARFPDLREKEPTLMGTYALEIPYNILKTTYNGCRSLLKK